MVVEALSPTPPTELPIHFGFGGGHNQGLLQSSPPLYQTNFFHCAGDLGVRTVRLEGTGTSYLPLLKLCAQYKLHPLPHFNYQSLPSASTLTNDVTRFLDAALAAGCPCHMVSAWNEPNSIGSLGGLMYPNSGWQQRLWFVNITTAKAAFAWAAAHGQNMRFIMCTSGAIDMGLIGGFLQFGAAQPGGIASLGPYLGLDVHIYQHTDPLTTHDGGPRSVMTLPIVRTALQSYAPNVQVDLLITEGVMAGNTKPCQYDPPVGARSGDKVLETQRRSVNDPGFAAGNLSKDVTVVRLVQALQQLNRSGLGLTNLIFHMLVDELPAWSQATDYTCWGNWRGYVDLPVGTTYTGPSQWNPSGVALKAAMDKAKHGYLV